MAKNAALLPLLLALTGCASPPATRPFTIAAASDLQGAFQDLGQRFEQETGQKVTFSFGSTGQLAQQIENGAPFDLFAAANEKFVDDLSAHGRTVEGSKRIYAVGRLVLAVHQGVPLHDLEGLLDPAIEHVAIANPDHAPYGLAAREALQKAGLWERLQPKLVLGENIRQTLQMVQTGNAEAGLVALSIARVPEVRCLPVSETLYTPLRQAIAVIRPPAGQEPGPNESSARRFEDLVISPEGQRILQQYGFQSPPPSR